jgi:2-desacetyl-2-hydroxyethyl bacteriochlorophyllide A dehydrogenase
MKSLAVIFPGPEQCELREEDIADPGPGEVTVRTLVSLISTGTEMWCYRGQFDAETTWAGWVKHPFHAGYSNVAEVVATGEGVEKLATGDRVFSLSPHQQFVTLAADAPHVVKLPEYADDEDATWSALAMITQTGVRRVEHIMGDRAVVIGAGPLGQLVTQYLRVIGCLEILVIDTVQQRLEMTLAHGATHAFCGSAADAGEFVAEHTEGRLADAVYDVTGHHAVLPMGLKLARQFGKLLLIGDTPHPSRQHLTQDVLARQVTVIGTHNAKLPPEQRGEDWPLTRQVLLFLEYVRRGQMRVCDLVTHRFSPGEAPEVYTHLQAHREDTMGVIYDWRNMS